MGEGYPMFDLALGEFRLVDYHSQVAEVFHLLSLEKSITMRLRPSNWDAILRSLVSPFFTPHRMPAEKEKEMKEQFKKEEVEEDKRRAEGYCPTLLIRLQELTEGFIMSENLLKPDVFHRLFQERHKSKNASHNETESSTEFHSLFEDIKVDNIFPTLVAHLANGEVIQFMTSEQLRQSLRALEAAEADPVFLSRSVASGEPDTQQLSLFRIPNTEEKENEGGTLSGKGQRRRGSGGRDGTPTCHSGGYGAVIKLWNTTQSNLAVFFSGTSASAGYSNGNRTGAGETAPPQSFLKASSRWLPPNLQPPRRFIQGKKNMAERTGMFEGETAHPSGVRMIQETSENKRVISSLTSANTYDLLSVYLQFEEVTPAASNVVLQSAINRHAQLKDLSRHHEVMKESFPADHSGAHEDQIRLQEVYHSMRKAHKLEKQRLKEQEQRMD